ncbi:TIGR02285 family protein [Paucibacter soli]|uniref:TIGR02285 family protein n=1 Tax=Paucibacter soli TaxID=3133433 RepID=UPI0030B221E9
MRALIGKALSALAFTCLAGAAPAQAGDTVRWLVQDLPPHFSYAGGRPPQKPADLGHGELDGMLRLLIARMPQYQHEFLDASLPRFEALVRQGQTICSVLHVRTPERLSWLYFTHTHPPLFSRQIHVILRRETLPRLEGMAQPLQLAELLQRNDLTGLLGRDRSFGPRIDAILQAQGSRAPKTANAARNMYVLAMLRLQRMDYTLEYPSVVDEFMRVNDASGELVKIPLAEARSTLVATVACSRNPEGRRQIEAIDAAVRKLAQDPNREAWIGAWRGDQLDEADRQRIHRYMDERAKAGPQIE